MTQAQIQEVMEQTYDTMTPSIKSTLGAELITNNSFDSGETGYTSIGANWTLAGGTATYSNTGGTTQSFQTSTDIFDDASALYKVTIDIESISGCKVRLLRSGTDVVSEHTDTAGIYTSYSTITGTGYAKIELTNGSGSVSCVVNSVTVKKVTNDLVGYWALDSRMTASSGLGVVDESVGGEALGAELFTGFTNTSPSGGTDYSYGSFTTSSTGFTGTGLANTSDVVTNSLWGSVDTAKLYKIVFDLTISAGSAPSFYWGPVSSPTIGGNGTGPSPAITLASGTNTLYAHVVGTSDRVLINSGNGTTITVSNFSVKEVTGNIGELK